MPIKLSLNKYYYIWIYFSNFRWVISLFTFHSKTIFSEDVLTNRNIMWHIICHTEPLNALWCESMLIYQLLFLCSFLFGILLVIGWCETPQASIDSSAQQVLDTLLLPNCEVSSVKRIFCLKNHYRTFDGTCNNLCNITTGAALTPHDRFPGLDPPTAYEQPGDQPRQFSSSGTHIPLPNARLVSKIVFSNFPNEARFTHMVMTWGQFLDHDLTLTEFTVGVDPQLDCGTSQEPCPTLIEKPDCIGVNISYRVRLRGDPSVRCTPLARSERNAEGNQVSFYPWWHPAGVGYFPIWDTWVWEAPEDMVVQPFWR